MPDVSEFTSDSLSCQSDAGEGACRGTPGVDFDPVHGRAFIRFSYARSPINARGGDTYRAVAWKVSRDQPGPWRIDSAGQWLLARSAGNAPPDKSKNS